MQVSVLFLTPKACVNETSRVNGTFKMFPFLRSPQHNLMASHNVEITSLFQNSAHLGSAILDFWLFPKSSKKVLKLADK